VFPAVDFDLSVKLAIYRHFADTGRRPTVADTAGRVSADAATVLESYRRLRGLRVLVLEEDGASIRMAPPFSGVETQHVVESRGVSYFANCAWDSFGIPAALGAPARISSRCEQTHEPLVLDVESSGPPEPESDWLFHCQVPAAQWWDDIVFT
jgi:hypothetical protein